MARKPGGLTNLGAPFGPTYPKDPAIGTDEPAWALSPPDDSHPHWVKTPPDVPEPEAGTAFKPAGVGSTLIMKGCGNSQLSFTDSGKGLSITLKNLKIATPKCEATNCKNPPDIIYNGKHGLNRRPEAGPSFVFQNVEADYTRVEIDGVDRFLLKDSFVVNSACPDINWNVWANTIRLQHFVVKYGGFFGFANTSVDVYRGIAWHMEFYGFLGEIFNDFQMHNVDMCLENLAWLDPRNQLQAYARTGEIKAVALPNVYYLSNGSITVGHDYFSDIQDTIALPAWTISGNQDCYLSGNRSDEHYNDVITVDEENPARYMYCQIAFDLEGLTLHDGIADVSYQGMYNFKAHIQVVSETDCISISVHQYPTNFGPGAHNENVEFLQSCNVSDKGAASPEDGRLCTNCDNGHSQCTNHLTEYNVQWFSPLGTSPCCFDGPYGDQDSFNMNDIWTYRVQVHHNGKISAQLDFAPNWSVIVNGPTPDIFKTVHHDQREAYLAEINRDVALDTHKRRPASDKCYFSGCGCGGDGEDCGDIVRGSTQMMNSNHWCSDHL